MRTSWVRLATPSLNLLNHLRPVRKIHTVSKALHKLGYRIGIDLVQIVVYSGAVDHPRVLQQQLQLLRKSNLQASSGWRA